MKKHWIWLVIAVVVVAAVFLMIWSHSKAGALSYVRRNLETLEEYATNCMQNPEDYVRHHGWNTRYRADCNAVIFEVSYLGFGSQADQKGFYFAPDGLPRAFGCDLGQEKTENGVRFLGEGDNYVLTEAIAPNWFWFEQHW